MYPSSTNCQCALMPYVSTCIQKLSYTHKRALLLHRVTYKCYYLQYVMFNQSLDCTVPYYMHMHGTAVTEKPHNVSH